MRRYFALFSCLTLIFAMFTLSACDDAPKKTYYMDNPTMSEIDVVIDDKSYKIPAMSGINISLTAGRHTLAYNGDKVNFFLTPKDQSAVINPTMSQYVLYQIIYTDKNDSALKDKQIENTEKGALTAYRLANGEEVYLPWKIINPGLFFNRYSFGWHYGINESIPHNLFVSEQQNNIKAVSQSKLFRPDDFYKFLREDRGLKGELPDELKALPSTQTIADIKPFDIKSMAVTVDCPNPEAQKRVDAYIVLVDSYFNMADPKDYNKLYGLVFSNSDSAYNPSPNFPSKDIAYKECSPSENKQIQYSETDYLTVLTNLERATYKASSADGVVVP